MKHLRTLSPLLLGVLFGAGLALSGMTDPQKVLGFLNIFGQWDPALLFVMASALTISFPGYQWLMRNSPKPLFEASYQLPQNKTVDKKLLIGASLFGLGWGLYGVCPGPALVALIYGQWQVWLFFAAMLGGMWACDRVLSHQAKTSNN